MAMMDATGWSGQDHAMHAGPEDDFQQFLDMGGLPNLPDGLNFDFNDFQASGAQMLQAPPREQMDTRMDGTDAPIMARVDPALQHQMPAMTSATSFQSIPTTIMPPQTPTEAIVDSIDAQIQFLQQQKLQAQQRQLEEQQAAFFASQQRRIIPPTPQSMELQPANAQFYPQSSQPEQQAMHQPMPQQHAQPQQQQQQPTPQSQPQVQQVIDYRYQRLKDQQDMSFTPLVSPAVTPLESHFPVDAPFAIPAAYFSPLTSPALHAQNDPLAVFEQRHGALNNNSPDEMDLESTPIFNGSSAAAPAPMSVEKKARKNTSKSRSKASVGKSPISKPQRRKTATTPNLNAQVLSELAENVEQGREIQPQRPQTAAATSGSSTTGATDSENGSVSPEALTDTAPIEMPPPPIPKPRSARPSPYIAPQNNGTPGVHPVLRPGMSSPATPASLMMLSSPGNRNAGVNPNGQDPMDTDNIEKFELPEPVNAPRPSLPPINTQSVVQTAPDTNEIGLAKTASFQPLPSPAFAKPARAASASASPQIAPGSSTPTNVRKTPQLLPRASSKKRGSVSSVHVSPALRPKISPNIKPLLPGGATAEETASHLLATKSNYQRILEGNQVPGVSYPTELSTNLTSKRTSHKIAEQGRRNRINSALQEIATLLPRPPPKEKESKGGDGEGGDKKDKGDSLPSSKASTVEMAIEYIKQLKKEVEDANRRADEAEKKLGANLGA